MKIRMIIRLLSVAALLLCIIPSCVKEGPAGLDGTNGTDGADGADGADGTAFCMDCHNSTTIGTITEAWELTNHATGTSFARGTDEDCSRCHSSEGFIAFVAGGVATGTSPVGCETCHSHGDVPVFQDENGDPSYIRTTAPVALVIDPVKTIDLGGESNLCVNCHQPRTAYPEPDADGNFAITNSHYGPHHGPQGTILMGLGMYPFTGSMTIPGEGAHPHAQAGCTTCHMNEASHSFSPGIDACAQCHGDVTTTDIDGKQTEVEDLMAELATKLQEEGVLDANGALVTGTYSVAVSRAFYNYSTVEEDKSEGAHNPNYVIAILTNTIESLQ